MGAKIYVVTSVETGNKVLVRAHNRVTARNTVTRTAFLCSLATQEELVELVAAGTKILDDSAAADDEQPEQPENVVEYRVPAAA